MPPATEKTRTDLPPTTQPSYRVGVSTHPGQRDTNEDACATAETDTCSVLIVADGAGGHAGGEVASEIVASEIAAYFNANRTAPAGPAAVRGALKAAQAAVRAEIQRTAKYHDMRSTALVVAATRSRAWVGHVGDSRAYLVRDGKAQQLTRDDTLVQTLIEVGEIDAEQARTHSKANVLLQSMGDPRTLDYHVSEPIEVGAGDTIVACSDGLAEILRDDEIGRLASAEGSSSDVAAALVKRAVDGGATDNVTVGVVRWQKSSKRPQVAAHGRVVKKRRRRSAVSPFRVAVGALVVATAVLGVAGVRRQRAAQARAAGEHALPAGDRPAAPRRHETPPGSSASTPPPRTADTASAGSVDALDAAASASASATPDDAASQAPAAPDAAGLLTEPASSLAPAARSASADAGAAAEDAAASAAATPVAGPATNTDAVADAGANPSSPAGGADAGEAAATTGTLYLRGLPPDATVWINQVETAADAQGAVSIPSGRRVLVRIHQAGRTDQTESVRVEPGHSTSIRVELTAPHAAGHGSSGATREHGGGASASSIPANPF